MHKFILLFLLLAPVFTATVSLSSDSSVVGATTNYNVVIQSHNNPTVIQTIFSQWSPNQNDPYLSNYAYFFQQSSSQVELSCKLKFSRTVIECDLPSSPTTINIRIENIRNPSSTKSYDVQFNLVGSTTESVTGTLTITQLSVSDILVFNSDDSVGATSTTVELYANFDYYVTASTILQITYDPNLISIDFNPDSAAGYAVESETSGTIELSSWTELSLGTKRIPNMTIINPQAAISYSLTATLYYNQSGTKYNIQSYLLTTTLNPIQFNSLSGSSSLELGKSQQSIVLSSMDCSYTPQNKSGSNLSYTQLDFDISDVTVSTCTNTTLLNSTNKICSFPSHQSKTITDVTTSISTLSEISIQVTLYTYHSGGGGYFSLCSSAFLISLAAQSISVTFDLSLCSSNEAGMENPNTILELQLQNGEADDIVRIEGIEGEIDGSWSNAGSQIYEYTLTASNIAGSTISIPLAYTNPTELITNEISKVEVQRPSISLIFAENSQTLSLCDVSEAGTPLISLSMEETSTFTKTNYIINLTPSFTDYLTSDSIAIEFTDNSHALGGGITVTINDASKTITVDSINGLLSIQNAFDGSSSYTIAIGNVLNPPSICTNCTIIVQLLSSSLLKERGTINPVYTESTVSLSHTSIAILETQNVTLVFTNSERSLYYGSVASSLTVQYPFLCSGLSSTTVDWSAFTQQLTIQLIDCEVQYLLEEYFASSELVNGEQSTSTSTLVQLKCPANCYICDASSVCSECVNTTFSSSIYLYGGECYSSCPVSTYLVSNSTDCFDCHVSCLNCDESTINDCTQCLPDYTFSNGICISVCGAGQYFSSVCTDCHANCDHCINSTYCYQCKESAVMVSDGNCQFTVCESPCEDCQGTNSTCTSCISSFFLYQNGCYENCPQGTYADEDSQTCQVITAPVLYFPITISSVFLIVLAFICNGCINRNLTDTSRKNIHLLTYCSSILAYMEIIATIIVIALSTSDTRFIGFGGIGIWVLANVLFGVYYCKYLKNDQIIEEIVSKMSERSKCIYYTTIVFSIVISLRTYRLLFCGLFKGVAPYLIKPKNKNENENIRKGKVSNENNENPPAENQTQSQGSDEAKISNFQLKRPFMIYITLLSILGSILFLITGILQLVSYQYINMIFWGLDLIIVVVVSAIITLLDMWVGIKRSFLLAVENPVEANETLQNLREYENGQENTHQKILHDSSKINKIKKKQQKKSPTLKKSLSPVNSKREKSVEIRKSTSPKSVGQKSNRSGSLNKSSEGNKGVRNSKEGEKNVKQSQKEIQKSKKNKLKNRYSGFMGRKSHKDITNSDDEDISDIPDIKVFDDVELRIDEEEIKVQKLKRLPKDNQKMLRSLRNIRSTQLSNRDNKETMKVNWKMDDIFVGFMNDEKNGETIQIRDHIKKLEGEKEDGEQESSYIEHLGESEIQVEDLEDVQKIEQEKKQ